MVAGCELSHKHPLFSFFFPWWDVRGGLKGETCKLPHTHKIPSTPPPPPHTHHNTSIPPTSKQSSETSLFFHPHTKNETLKSTHKTCSRCHDCHHTDHSTGFHHFWSRTMKADNKKERRRRKKSIPRARRGIKECGSHSRCDSKTPQSVRFLRVKLHTQNVVHSLVLTTRQGGFVQGFSRSAVQLL